MEVTFPRPALNTSQPKSTDFLTSDIDKKKEVQLADIYNNKKKTTVHIW